MVTFRHDHGGTPAAAWSSRRSALAELEWATAGGSATDAVTTVVVLAAHPDDEALGAAGLITAAHTGGLDLLVVCATAGEGSHPRSPTHRPDLLAERRIGELTAAVQAVAPQVEPVVLGIPDGAVSDHEGELATRLVDLVGDGRGTVLVAPWRHDGHPDHEAAGRAAATAAARTGARLLEYPIWFWHWGSPESAPWGEMRRLALGPSAIAAKAAAIAAHRTQVEPLSPAPGDEVLLHADLLAHFGTGEEVFVLQAAADDDLDELHLRAADPWGVETRWYEQRKRDLLLAMLPRERFRRGVEVGCSTGLLAGHLAARCERLDAVDSSAGAVEAARSRLRGRPGVHTHRGEIGAVWSDLVQAHPEVDLVVLSEVGYFLSPRALDDLATEVGRELAADGVVVLCHWRHPIEGWVMDATEVHRRFVERVRRPVIAQYVDRDVEILLVGASSTLPDPHA